MLRKIKPKNNYLLIEPIQEKTTKSGIVIPEIANLERPIMMGKVIAVDKTSTFKKEQVVIFRKYGAEEMQIDGKLFYFVPESDVLALMNHDNDNKSKKTKTPR